MSKINVNYFTTKLYTGMSYIVYSKKVEQICNKFSEKILPYLQEVLKKELSNGVEW